MWRYIYAKECRDDFALKNKFSLPAARSELLKSLMATRQRSENRSWFLWEFSNCSLSITKKSAAREIRPTMRHAKSIDENQELWTIVAYSSSKLGRCTRLSRNVRKFPIGHRKESLINYREEHSQISNRSSLMWLNEVSRWLLANDSFRIFLLMLFSPWSSSEKKKTSQSRNVLEHRTILMRGSIHLNALPEMENLSWRTTARRESLL